MICSRAASSLYRKISFPRCFLEVESHVPTDHGESPISKMTDWVNLPAPAAPRWPRPRRD